MFERFYAKTSDGAGEAAHVTADATTPYKDWPNDAGFDASVEQLEPKELAVRGFIPSSAAGILYRTGPGDHRVRNTASGDFEYSHWFDGFTHVYRFELIPTPDGKCKVVYTSRRQVDGLIERIRKTGRLEGFSFGQKRDPCVSYFQKLKSVFESSPKLGPDSVNVGVTIAPNVPGFPSIAKSGENIDENASKVRNLVTFTDATQMKTMDPETLEPAGVTDQSSLHPDLTGVMSCAHAHWDPANGDVYNYNLAFGASSTYRIFKTSAATGKTDILATISGKDLKPAYIHSFFLTEDYLILAVWSAHFGAGGAAILWERNLLDAISRFNPNEEVKWLVVDRKHGRGLVAKFSSPAMFAFHQVNAWQEERDGKTDIYCDIIQYANLDVMHRLYYQNLISTGKGVEKYSNGELRANTRPDFFRYRLAGIPSKGTLPSGAQDAIKAEVIKQIPGAGELPTINPQYSTKKYRYMYSIGDRGLSSWVDSLVKTDVDTGKMLHWEQQHHTPGEAIFVPDPNGTTEDDGFLLSVILDGDKGTSYLICLDARDMKELGRAECDVAVGMGFHGRFLADTDLKL